jgi:hypothetical protein
LVYCNVTGKKRVIESGGIKVVLAAVNDHLDCANLCENAGWALANIVRGSKESVGLLISLAGGAAVAKVRTKWPDDGKVQKPVKSLTKLIVAEMSSWM